MALKVPWVPVKLKLLNYLKNMKWNHCIIIMSLCFPNIITCGGETLLVINHTILAYIFSKFYYLLCVLKVFYFPLKTQKVNWLLNKKRVLPFQKVAFLKCLSQQKNQILVKWERHSLRSTFVSKSLSLTESSHKLKKTEVIWKIKIIITITSF